MDDADPAHETRKERDALLRVTVFAMTDRGSQTPHTG